MLLIINITHSWFKQVKCFVCDRREKTWWSKSKMSEKKIKILKKLDNLLIHCIFLNAWWILHLDIPSYDPIVYVEIIECASYVQ